MGIESSTWTQHSHWLAKIRIGVTLIHQVSHEIKCTQFGFVLNIPYTMTSHITNHFHTATGTNTAIKAVLCVDLRWDIMCNLSAEAGTGRGRRMMFFLLYINGPLYCMPHKSMNTQTHRFECTGTLNAQ